MRRALLVLLCLAPLFSIFAQSNTVTGTVTDTFDNTPLPGVNILVKGSTRGTVTDANGTYSLEVDDPNVVLVFSFVGYVSEEVALESRTTVDISLTPDVNELSEVVVIGFGTQERKDVTGAISSVSGEELTVMPVPSFEQALTGRSAGVQVITGSGIPGAGASLRVRGVGSLNSSEPLYVIDGIIIDNSTGGGNTTISPLSTINPNDIESIDILKDASATAIYGARAGNGVVIITTKRGKEGTVSLSFDGYTSVNVLDRSNFNMLSGPEWARYYADVNAENNRPTYSGQPFVEKVINGADLPTYDWFDYAYRNGRTTSYNLSLNAGSEKSQLYTSVNYFNQEGIFPNSDLERYTVRLNSDTKVGKRLKIGNTLTVSRTEANTVANVDPNANLQNWLERLLGMNPYKPIFDSEGNYAGLSDQDPDAQGQLDHNNQHVIWRMEQQYDKEIRNRILGSLFADLTIADGLVFHTMGSIDWGFNKFEMRTPSNDIDGQAAVGPSESRLQMNYGESRTWFVENTLQYSKDISDHSFNVMLGYQAQNNLNTGFGAMGGAFVDNDYWFYGRPQMTNEITDGDGNVLATIPLVMPSASNYQSESAFVSAFGRLIYDFQDKYLLTATVRRDGSSRFGPAQRWGTFPAVSAGWRMSEEEFIRTALPQVSDMKLRVGWGISGSDNTTLYQWISRTGSGTDQQYVFNGGPVPGATVTRMANEFLGWEEIEMINLGLDVGLFGQRVEVTLDYFDKTTKGMLLPFTPALELGALENPTGNLGEINNKGFELALNTVNIAEGDLRWNSNFNISFIRNRVVNLPEDADRFANPNITRVGEEVGALYGFRMNGLFQNWEEVYAHAYQNQSMTPDPETAEPVYTGNTDAATAGTNTAPGDIRFVDINNDGIVDENNDRVVIGSTIPDFTWGFNNTLTYKNFNLSVFFQGVHGVDIYNGLRIIQERSNASFENKRATVLERWTGENTSNSFPRAALNDPNRNERISDRWVEDGSYVRLKNIRLSYNFPQRILQSIGLRNGGLNIYTSATNLFTITKYTGFDPEVGLRNGASSETAGVDAGVYPLTRQYTVGLQVTF